MNPIIRYWRNLSLGNKLTSLAGALVIFIVLSLNFLAIQGVKTGFRQELEDQANLFLGTLPISMRDSIYRHELDELADIAKVVSANKNITLFIVYDSQGITLVDSSHDSLAFSQSIDPLGSVLIKLDQNDTHIDWQEGQLVSGRAILLGNQTIGAVAVGLSTEPLNQKIASLTQQSYLFGIVTLVIGIGLTYWTARQITIPLSELTEVASEMADGDLSIRTHLNYKDEIGQLGEAFNQMATSIETRDTELRELAIGLERKVADRTVELRQQNEILEKIAISDPLTKIYNRRYFFELAQKEIKRTIRYNRPLSVVLIDADHFKNINDTYGHLVGDAVLINLAKSCQENIRAIDIFARYGGEEFVLLMPEADCDAALLTAERLRTYVDENPAHVEGQFFSLTISVGVTCWNQEEELNFKALLAKADQALYKSKELGKNRVTVWTKAI